MFHPIRNILKISAVGAMMISLASCFGKESPSWDYSFEELCEAASLRAKIDANESLKLTFSSDESLFKPDISKSSILLVDKDKVSGDSSGRLTGKDLLAGKIEQYGLKQIDEKNIEITLSDYALTTYCILVDKSATTSGKLAEGGACIIREDVKGHPSIDIDSDPYYAGEHDPEIIISFDNVDVKNPRNFEFGGAFAGISPSEPVLGNGELHIPSKGQILSEDNGIVTLRSGFFDGIDQDISLFADIDSSLAYIDQQTITYDQGQLSFNIKSTFDAFKREINETNASLPQSKSALSVTSLRYKDDYTASISFRVEADSYPNVDAILTYLHGAELTLSGCFQNKVGSFKMGLNVERPRLRLNTTFALAQNLLELDVTIKNAQKATWDVSDVSLSQTNLILDGEHANASIDEFTTKDNGFHIRYALKEGFGRTAEGKISLSPAKVRTLWGTPYSLSRFFETFDQANMALGSHSSSNGNIEEKILKADVDGNDVAAGFLTVFAIGEMGGSLVPFFAEGRDWKKIEYSDIFGALSAIMEAWGADGDSLYNPTIQDVLDELNKIDSKVDLMIGKLDGLYDEIAQGDAAELMGIDKILYNQYDAAWNGFRQSYEEPLENLIRNYETDLRDALVNIACSEAETYRVKVIFTEATEEKTGQTILVPSAYDPKSSIRSLDGREIVQFLTLDIPTSYFAPARDYYLSTHTYQKDFPDKFKQCLNDYLEAESPSDDLDVFGIYMTILDHIHHDIMTVDRAQDCYNLTLNYCKGIGDSDGQSQLQKAFKMMESYYNFQNEANGPLSSIRSKTRLSLWRYVDYTITFAKYAGTNVDLDALKKTFDAADKFIKNNDNMRDAPDQGDYCYVTQTNLKAPKVTPSFSISYSGTKYSNLTFNASLSFGSYFSSTNASSMLNETDVLHIFNRYQNLVRSGDCNSATFLDYLQSRGLSVGWGSDGISGIIVSFDINNLIDATSAPTDIRCLATALPHDGQFFNESSYYNYGQQFKVGSWYTDPQCYSAKEYSGRILNTNSLTATQTWIARYARYDESHTYWKNDEHSGFKPGSDSSWTSYTALVRF